MIEAEYESTCETCGCGIEPGDMIECVDGDWVHEECAEDEGLEFTP